ncbi:MAG: FIG017823: ATPase, MoxR family [uncultured Phycisphaerae bacterium]|uniref:FIG017823: ATPase, MoxR family n=1 Tax=uncultured Phycisphaerae bacterium TaxID=904963 RepID=A0A6J4NDZ0_9BACT|nr:MAG: FIG017823: ATPase, MoxR family [uncultured Phycisphaerae bacterium]
MNNHNGQSAVATAPAAALDRDADLAGLGRLRAARDGIRKQMAGTIVGQDDVVEQLLVCLFARGHCLLEGVPGLAKTLMIRTLAQCLSLNFSRIQFTPDLMPSDITGTDVMFEDRGSGERTFKFLHGPVFTNVLLADEINRTPPKTQAALLEGMQERQVSAGGKRYPLPDPFFVLATQNPIEQEGTYPLPEAQLDRFMMKVTVGYPDEDEERRIYRMTTTGTSTEPTPVLSGDEMLQLQRVVRRVPVSDMIVDYVASVVRSTRLADPKAPAFVRDWVLWGVGPRGGQSLISAAQARAALDGRPEVEVQDIKALAAPVLRHRLVLNYNAESQGQTPDTVVKKLLEAVPLHDGGAGKGRVERLLKS